MCLLLTYSSNLLSLQVKNMSPSMIWQQQVSSWDSKTNQIFFFFFFFFSRNCILTNSSLLFVTFTFKVVNNDADAVLGPGFLFIQYNSQAIIQSTLWKITIYSYKLIRYGLDCSYWYNYYLKYLRTRIGA